MEELRKNILIKLLVILTFFFLAGSFLFWFLGVKRDTLLLNYLLLFFSLLFFILFVLLLLSYFALAGFLARRKLPKYLKPLLRIALGRVLPFIFYAGRLMRFPSVSLQKAFVGISNYIVLHQGIKIKPEELLVLAPHCLQLASCPFKVTHDVKNCRHCGKCQISDLIEICSKRGVQLKIVTGGTLARKEVKERRPKIIVAIACERDLSSGIKDTFPLPVYGIFNIRPNGPCFNTRVDLDVFKEALDNFLIKN